MCSPAMHHGSPMLTRAFYEHNWFYEHIFLLAYTHEYGFLLQSLVTGNVAVQLFSKPSGLVDALEKKYIFQNFSYHYLQSAIN